MGRINREKFFFIILTVVMLTGVVVGTVYMALSDADSGLYSYLTGFLESFGENGKNFEIFKNALKDNLKIWLFVSLCGFFRAGTAGNVAVSGLKGFISGFTVSAFIRYYGLRGLIIPMSMIGADIVFIPAFLIFSACSCSYSLQKKSKENTGHFLILCLIFMTIFCVTALFEGYVTTTFIKLMKRFVVKM